MDFRSTTTKSKYSTNNGCSKTTPIFIILISVVGPILEEYVFRKVFFGELYDRIKGNRIIAFLIASIVSSLLLH